MPFYEYECPHCRAHTEVMQKISDKPLGKCPQCGKKGLRKLMSAPVFRLKGSGWYETDFKSDKEGRRNLAGGEEAPAAKDDAGKADASAKADGEGPAKGEAPAKGETKPDAKAESKPDAKVAARGAAKSSAGKSRPAPVARKAPARKAKPAVRPAARRPAGKRGKR